MRGGYARTRVCGVAAASYCGYAEIGCHHTADPCGERKCLHTLGYVANRSFAAYLLRGFCGLLLPLLRYVQLARAGRAGGDLCAFGTMRPPAFPAPAGINCNKQKHFPHKFQLLKFWAARMASGSQPGCLGRTPNSRKYLTCTSANSLWRIPCLLHPWRV
jgi:hypothetical protein